MSQTYEIKLKPTGSFYFGGEESFSSATLESIANKSKPAREYFKKRQGYYAKSERFPQQTQLLGMIRKELLRHNKKLLYFKNYITVPQEWKSEATKIVGSKWHTNQEPKLGVIETLSPLYLGKNDKVYVSAPMDFGLKLETTGTAYINGIPKEAVSFKKGNGRYFDAKDSLYTKYHSLDCDCKVLNKSSKKDCLDLNKIFKKDKRTHTQTFTYKEDNDEQLFKVSRYCLDDNYYFIFYLTLSDGVYLKDALDTIVSLGGEGSYFHMHVKTIEVSEKPDFEEYYKKLRTKETRVMLTSDSFIDPCSKIFEYCKTVLTQKQILRTLQGNKENKKFHFKKSLKKILLKKGTVFYPKDEESLAKICSELNRKNFQSIGYNQYTILKGDNHAS